MFAHRRAGPGISRWWRHLLALLAGWGTLVGEAGESRGATPLLTNLQQVLDLGLEAARASAPPVRVQGVVTYPALFSPGWFFLQDAGAGVMVMVNPPPFTVVSGQRLEVEGDAVGGVLAPYVRGRTMRLLGTAPLPVPRAATAIRLGAGEEFGRWVTLQGTVRDAAISKSRLVLLCVENGFHFQVWCTYRDNYAIPPGLLDARLGMTGVAWTDVDADGKPIGFRLHQPGTNCLTILKPTPADSFAAPGQPIRSLRPAGMEGDQRIKVVGVVTVHSPGGWLCVQDASGAALARQLHPIPRDEDPRAQYSKHDLPAVQPGDRVELIGAPLAGQPFSPVLEDAEFRVVGHGAPPAPQAVSAAELLTGRYDAQVVTLRARVLDVESKRKAELYEQRLWLEADGNTFEACLETSEVRPLPVQRKDFVVLTGACLVEPGQFQQVRSFCLHLRGPDDLATTPPPPWWNSRYAAIPLAAFVTLGLAGVVWISLLRREVASRTAELQAANAQLRAEMQERRRFVSVIEATSDLVAMADLEGRVLYLNSAGCRMMGLPENADVRGMNIWEFYPEDVRRLFRETGIPEAMASGAWSNGKGDVRFLTRTGTEVPVSFVGLVIKTPDGKPEHLACVARDITGRQRTEEDLRAALAAEKELNQLKSNFVSMVSHEFRTPLSAIQSSAELLQRYFERLTVERRAKLLQAIVDSTHAMARMMEDVLLLSRVESARYEFQPRQLSLAELAQRLADEVTAATNDRCLIRVQVGPLPELAWCDEGLVRHILTNLLSNAVKYSPFRSCVEFGIEQAGQDAVFTIRDHGLGIPAVDQPKLFEAFRRGSNVGDTPGTGLGLVIVQRCARIHGGSVGLTAPADGGTLATVRLPLFAGKESNTALFRRWRERIAAGTA